VELLQIFQNILHVTGIYNFTAGQAIMICVGLLLIYLGIVKGFEPLLLIPIGSEASCQTSPWRTSRRCRAR
jgi:oxaloacetate decarboxylase beta subunit